MSERLENSRLVEEKEGCFMLVDDKVQDFLLTYCERERKRKNTTIMKKKKNLVFFYFE